MHTPIKITTLTLCFLTCNAISAERPVLDIQHWQTKNGAEVYFVPAHEIPMLDVQVAFAAGSSRDGDHPGVATLTGTLLDQGAAHLNADQIAEQFADVGAQFNSDVARDMSVVSLRTLTDPKFLQPAIKNFHTVLTSPTFALPAFNREQNTILSTIAQSNQQADDIATRLFYSTVYGNHPYAHPVLGTAESVKTLKAADVQTFYKQYYCGKNAVMAIVGDMTVAQAKQLSEDITANMPSGEHAPTLPEPLPLKANVQQHLAFPASQTNIRIGQATLQHNNPDYFPLLVGNYTLGGGMLVSRLAEEVREKRGLSYSVYSSFQPMASKGPFLISLGTKNATAKEALSLTQNIMNDYVHKGPTSAELDAAKNYLTGSFALRLDSSKAIATNLLVLGFYNMPMNFYDTYRDNIEKVDHKAVFDAFTHHLQLKHMAVVSVGGEQAF